MVPVAYIDTTAGDALNVLIWVVIFVIVIALIFAVIDWIRRH